MSAYDLDPRVSHWLQDGPPRASERVLEAVVEHARSHSRREPLCTRWSRAVGTMVHGHGDRAGMRLALVAVTLVAVLAGTLYVGARRLADSAEPAPLTPPVPALAACPPGSEPDRPGPVDQERPVVDATSSFTFDTQSGRLVAVAGSPAEIWTFDVCTNTWHRSAVRLPFAPKSIGYDVANDVTVMFGRRVVGYDADADTVAVRGPSPASTGVVPVYRSATGQFVAFGGFLNLGDRGATRAWTYDWSEDAWQEVSQQGQIPPYLASPDSLLAYDASVDRLVLRAMSVSPVSGPAATYELDPRTWTWDRLPVTTPEPGSHPSGVAYDGGHAATIVVGTWAEITGAWKWREGVEVFAYDATVQRWDMVSRVEQGTTTWVPAPADFRLTYDTVNHRIIAIGWPQDGVHAFDLDRRSWMELLASRYPERGW